MINFLPDNLKVFLSEIEDLGFSLCLVGGATRDYLFSKKLGHDLDFEIRPKAPLQTEWEDYYKKLHRFFAEKKISYTELPYLITRVRFGDCDLEFSSPRVEINDPKNFSHHHFTAILDPSLSYDISFKRRDFSINAIGVEFDFKKNKVLWIDPFDGINDLNVGLLKNLSIDFFNDSVRFLRMIRFQLKFPNFKIENELLLNLALFNLSELSPFHFKEELFKSTPAGFLNMFSKLVKEHHLNVSSQFHIWTSYQFPKELVTREEILGFIFLQNDGVTKEVHDCIHFFALPEKKLNDLSSFYRSYQLILQVKKDEIKELLKLSAGDVLSSELLKNIKNVEDKKEWRFWLHLNDLNPPEFNWEDIAFEKASVEELHSIPVPLRSYFPFYKNLKKKFCND